MENQTSYQIRKAQPREHLPDADLLEPILHEKKLLDVKVFGPGTYTANLANMSKPHFFSKEHPSISFRRATTSESVSTAVHKFEDYAKPTIFDSGWLQAGYIVRGTEGVWANPPKDKEGNFITDEGRLKKFLDECNQVDDIWLYQGSNPDLRDLSYVPYDSFKTGVQDCEKFIEGGLARGLEHTATKKAEKFKAIASPKNYKIGVDVWAFDSVRTPILRVVGLVSLRLLIDLRLDVAGDDWCGRVDGFAFGVRK